MAEIINFPEIPSFGACPRCGKTDGFINVGPNYWNVCDRHKTKWYVGNNPFYKLVEESEEVRLKNEARLEGYREVEPVYPGPANEQNGYNKPRQTDA
jgi:hypothetical protein